MVVRKADSICSPSGILTRAYVEGNIDATYVTSIDDDAFSESTHNHIYIHRIQNSQLIIHTYGYLSTFDMLCSHNKIYLQNFYDVKNMIFDSRDFSSVNNVKLSEFGISYIHFPLILITNTSIACGSLRQIHRPEDVNFMRIEGTENENVLNLLYFSSLTKLHFIRVKLNEVYIPRSIYDLESYDNPGANIRTKVFDYYDNFTAHNGTRMITCPGKDKAKPNILTINGNQFSVISTVIDYGDHSNLECIKICT
ncbi:hypothetical protein GJ496_001022 [Pomphorhynchus laevis]|nr:hypothetical protein GJ496_001022 [Pomphorhynchus laevis]